MVLHLGIYSKWFRCGGVGRRNKSNQGRCESRCCSGYSWVMGAQGWLLPIVLCFSFPIMACLISNMKRTRTECIFPKKDKQWWKTDIFPFPMMKREHGQIQCHQRLCCQWGSLHINERVPPATWNHPSSTLCRKGCKQRIHGVKHTLRECLGQACWAHHRYSKTVHSKKFLQVQEREASWQPTDTLQSLLLGPQLLHSIPQHPQPLRTDRAHWESWPSLLWLPDLHPWQGT